MEENKIKIDKEFISKWMNDYLNKNKYINAANLADSFLKEHQIKDCLDPLFSLVYDVAYSIGAGIKEKQMLNQIPLT